MYIKNTKIEYVFENNLNFWSEKNIWKIDRKINKITGISSRCKKVRSLGEELLEL